MVLYNMMLTLTEYNNNKSQSFIDAIYKGEESLKERAMLEEDVIEEM